MKRTASTLALIIALLFSAVVGTLFVSLAKANLFPYFYLPTEPDTTPPVIAVHSPSPDQNYNSTTVLLNFTVTKPNTWVNYLWTSNYYVVGRVVSYRYVLDGKVGQVVPVDEEFHLESDPKNLENTLSFSQNITTANGWHNITIIVDCETAYRVQSGAKITSVLVPIRASSEVINFAMRLFIEVLSPENRTYDSSSISLNFTVDESPLHFSCSLDGAENMAVEGNTTLTRLANGDHNVTVYAKDEAGNVVTSKTVHFIVDVPFPTALVITASGASIAAIATALLVYFKKRKHVDAKQVK